MASAAETSTTGLILKGVNKLLSDQSFKLRTQPAVISRKIAEQLVIWIPKNEAKVLEFEESLVKSLCKCMQSRARSQKVRRERMWTSYHAVRTSKEYRTKWSEFLRSSIGIKASPIFYQYVGNFVFKELIKLHHPVPQQSFNTTTQPLTFNEMNGLRYAAGYIPRALKKKLLKSTHPLKEDIQLCILDMLDDGDEEDTESQCWVKLVDRGGLTHVNNVTFEIFFNMEMVIRKHIHNYEIPDFDAITTELLQNEEILFLWSMLSADWDENSAAALLEMVTRQWVKIRGFSLASAWIERYKVAQKQTTQKSKGVRKQLLTKKSTPKQQTSTSTPPATVSQVVQESDSDNLQDDSDSDFD